MRRDVTVSIEKRFLFLRMGLIHLTSVSVCSCHMTKVDAVNKLADLLEAKAEVGDIQSLAESVGITRQRLYQLAAREIEERARNREERQGA